MKFQTERDLQAEIAARDLFNDELYTATFVRREVPVGGCIPDVVYVRFSNVPSRSLWPQRWTYRHAFVLWALRRRRVLRPETIASWAYESIERVRPILRDLARSGAIEIRKSGALCLSSEMTEIDAEVVAVEAKLKKWRQALQQARIYTRFADRVFVAMDAIGIPRQEKLLEFRSSGIGLCKVGKSAVHWLVEASNLDNLPGPEREYLVASAATSVGQTAWSLRYRRNASSHALT